MASAEFASENSLIRVRFLALRKPAGKNNKLKLLSAKRCAELAEEGEQEQ